MIEIKKQTAEKRVNFNENTEVVTNISFDIVENGVMLGNGSVSRNNLQIYFYSDNFNPEEILEIIPALLTEGGAA